MTLLISDTGGRAGECRGCLRTLREHRVEGSSTSLHTTKAGRAAGVAKGQRLVLVNAFDAAGRSVSAR